MVDILLVEDNPNDVELAVRALSSVERAPEITVARDGVEALEFIFGVGEHSGRAILDRPSLVLLDLKLPRVDGFEVLARIRSDPRLKAVPVVIFSSSGEPGDMDYCYSNGANSYVVKPVAYESYVKTLRHVGLYWLSVNERPF